MTDLYGVCFLVAAGTLSWLLFSAHRSARKQHSSAMKLLAYSLEIREAAYWSSLLGANLEGAASHVPWIETSELRRWRDDGAAQAAALATCLVLELEKQHPSIKQRLGHSPIQGFDRQRVTAMFRAMTGRKDEGSLWASSDRPDLVPLREYLARHASSRA